jgi:hypothetical protein
MNARMKLLMIQGITVLSLMFTFGTSCSDNSGLKSQLAAMQAQMAAQQQITKDQIDKAHSDTKLNCYSNATTTDAKALCDKL